VILKPPKHRDLVGSNITKIIELEKYTYETEHVTRFGEIIPIEMSSRIVDYEDNQVIISVGRNIQARKDLKKNYSPQLLLLKKRNGNVFLLTFMTV
jgi:hypothetical protein